MKVKQVKILELGEDFPVEPGEYVLGNDGIYFYREHPCFEGVLRLNSVDTPICPKLRWTAERIPWQLIVKILDYFVKVQVFQDTEALIHLYYHPVGRRFLPIFQEPLKIGLGNVSADPNRILPGMVFFGSIHSHGTGAAYHSSLDQESEKKLDGLHIVVGNLDSPGSFSISSVISASGNRFPVDPKEVIEGLNYEHEPPIPGTKLYSGRIFEKYDAFQPREKTGETKPDTIVPEIDLTQKLDEPEELQRSNFLVNFWEKIWEFALRHLSLVFWLAPIEHIYIPDAEEIPPALESRKSEIRFRSQWHNQYPTYNHYRETDGALIIGIETVSAYFIPRQAITPRFDIQVPVNADLSNYQCPSEWLEGTIKAYQSRKNLDKKTYGHRLFLTLGLNDETYSNASHLAKEEKDVKPPIAAWD